MTITTRTLRRLAAIALSAVPVTAATAGDIVSWQNPENGVWSDANSWLPHVPTANDYVLIGGSVNAENTDVLMTFSVSGLEFLVISDGMELFTDGHQLDMSGTTVRVKDENEVEEGEARSKLWINDGGFATDFLADILSIENRGVVRMTDGATALVTSSVDIEDDTIIVGEGHLRLQGNSGVALDNNGGIRGLESGLTITQEGTAPLDLDGSNDTGVLLQRLTIDSGPLADPFDGRIDVIGNDVLTMNVQNGWLLGVNGELIMGASGNNARLAGTPMGVQGTVTVVGTGNTIESDVIVFASGHFNLGYNDYLTVEGDVVAGGGLFEIEGDSVLHFAGALDTNDSEFRFDGGTVVGAVLDNDAGGLIHGYGAVGSPVTNDGVISADGGTLILAGFANDLDGGFADGTIEALTGDLHITNISDPWFDGTVRVGTGHEVFADGFEFVATGFGGVEMMGGTIRSNEWIRLGGSIDVTLPSTLDGDVEFYGSTSMTVGDDLTITGSTTLPHGASFVGAGAIVSPPGGVLTLADVASVGCDIVSHGTFRVQDGVGLMEALGDVESRGTCELELTVPYTHDQLTVGGTLTLAGQVVVTMLGPDPEEGDEYDVFLFGAFQDDGYQLVLPQIPPELAWDWSDFETAGILRVGPDTCLADINDDGFVNFADILLVIGAWGNADPWSDLDESGIVDFADILIVVGAWGPC
ncbi:MAG: hypothetical protein ACYTGP_01550 [Planctomycetota bacterium]|jgi:hypothetical protein